MRLTEDAAVRLGSWLDGQRLWVRLAYFCAVAFSVALGTEWIWLIGFAMLAVPIKSYRRLG